MKPEFLKKYKLVISERSTRVTLTARFSYSLSQVFIYSDDSSDPIWTYEVTKGESEPYNISKPSLSNEQHFLGQEETLQKVKALKDRLMQEYELNDDEIEVTIKRRDWELRTEEIRRYYETWKK